MKALLEITEIKTFYGQSQVLFGMALAVNAGEVVTLMGRNGMGKTTTIRSVMGLTPAREGRIFFDGREIHDLALARGGAARSRTRARGPADLPEPHRRGEPGRDRAQSRRRQDAVDAPAHLRAVSRHCRAAHEHGQPALGREQQMLAVGRALMTNPRLLILDEATEGLAPLIRQEIWNTLEKLKAAGQSILVVDKNVDALARIADRHYIIEKGKVMWTGTSPQLLADKELQHRYLGV
ncbi:MAG: ATP-binding cassette domain-containing protein [Rhodospirillales bacterium]|nr:ATP-binding cassette domain-containing protein [Rhodospirillales bacterium]